MSAKNIPQDKINLRLILVSGKTKEFVFTPSDSAGDIAVHVYDNWPEADWVSESVSRAEILRLIYQGRFLHSVLQHIVMSRAESMATSGAMSGAISGAAAASSDLSSDLC